MSRVGMSPIVVPSDVTVTINGAVVSAKGKLGLLSHEVRPEVSVEQADGKLHVKLVSDTKTGRMLWGTTRNVLRNLVEGVSKGYSVDLEINGVGYRAAVQGKELVLQLGYSHEIRHAIPEGIEVKCATPTAISVFGADRRLVGQVAAEVRAYRGPEPYKGKGIKRVDEVILRKEGKKK